MRWVPEPAFVVFGVAVGLRVEHVEVLVEVVLDVLARMTKIFETRPKEASGSDYSALLDFLERPDVLDALRKTDPLMPAHLRGLRLREDLLATEGGVRTT